MKAKNKSGSQTSFEEGTVSPQTTESATNLREDTLEDNGPESNDGADLIRDVNNEEEKDFLDVEELDMSAEDEYFGADDSRVGNWLRDIDRDAFVSQEAARNAGLGIMIGSAFYINEHFRSLEDALEDSLPEDFSVESYVPGEMEELPSELEALFEGAIDTQVVDDLPEMPDYSAEDVPVDLEPVDPSEYDSLKEEVAAEADPIIDEVVKNLNTDVTSWEQMGIDPSENLLEQLDPETVSDAILISFDNLAHMGITGTAANIVAGAADKVTDRESVIAGAGMSTALGYAILKEGLYEGGAGMQFDPQRIDVQGDWMADTIGAGLGTWSYLQNRGQEEALEGEIDTGLTGSAAYRLGRAYEKARYLASTNLPDRMLQYDFGELDEDYSEVETDEADVGIVKYELEQGFNGEEGSSVSVSSD